MLGVRFFVVSPFAGAEFAGLFAGRSPGKVVSRLNPGASWVLEEEAGGDAGGD